MSAAVPTLPLREGQNREAVLGRGQCFATRARIPKGSDRQSRLKITPPSQPMVSASATQISP